MTFDALFVPASLRAAVSDDAWLAAMLDAERALARAEARAGAISSEAAAAVEAVCDPSLYDAAALAAEGRSSGSPVVPLAKAMRERAEAAHHGATSQDIVDTAAMLVARNAIAFVLAELDAAAAAAAVLAERHRDTEMAARTLLQQAVPTTFGAKAAGWLVGLVVARGQLRALRFPAQLGGAAGTLSVLGDHGLDVLSSYAHELGLAEPVVPWHAHRGPVAAIAHALDDAAAACAKAGLDVVLLAQREVAEVSEAAGGESSAMPHKQNPAQAVLARACARVVHAETALLGGDDHEHERAAGAWHAEWGALSRAIAYAGGAATAIRECLEGLRVDEDRMRANMGVDLSGGTGSAGAFVDRALAAYRDST